MWAAVSKSCVIGPYFFEEDGRTVTVNGQRYRRMLREFLVPELRSRGLSRCRLYFQQDRATCHTSNESIAEVKRLFPGKVISKRGDVNWPPCSPDLSVCDFFLWGYLKNKVYVDQPRTLDELKDAISQEIRNIPREMLERE
uniref:Transposase n=1 Tax=Cacopsylla melanoneura TaxID=428564 RepID=A0A8D9B3Q2_9HEMI